MTHPTNEAAELYTAEAIDDGRGWVIPVEEGGIWYISQAAPSLLQERDRLAERLYAALWDERVVLDAGIKGFDERRYRAAAKRIVGRLAATSTATEEPNE